MRTALLCLALATPALGYIHVPPQTLKEMCEHSGQIRALKVKAFNKEKGVADFEVTESVRGKRKSGIDSFRLVVRPDAQGAKSILDKLAEGKVAVLFSSESGKGKDAEGFGYAFIDEAAFCVAYNAEGEYWLFLRAEPGLSAAYHGPAKDLPELVKAVLMGKAVKVPTKARAKNDYSTRGLYIDEALRKNRPTYPKQPLPTAWGKPSGGLQAGVRINPAVKVGGAVAVAEVVVRNVTDKPVIFTHLQLGFGGEHDGGTVTAKAEEVAGGEGVSPKGTRSAVLVSPGDSYALATVPIFRPDEGQKWKYPRPKVRLGDNRLAAEGVAVRVGDGKVRKDVELSTGYLDVHVSSAKEK